MTDAFLDWHLGDNFGWGLVGLNLFLQWANDPSIRPLMGQPISRASLGLTDPLRIARAAAAIERSNQHLSYVPTAPDGTRRVDATVVAALGNDFVPSPTVGRRNVARCIFERTDLSGVGATLDRYDAVLVASEWNARLVEAATGRKAKVLFEGVDPSLFCPGPKSGILDRERFHVFSGGKVEFRKGQDLVLEAFRAFSRTRPDCVLVTAWQSIWPHRSLGFRGRLPQAVEAAPNGLLDIGRWAHANGIDPNAVVDIGLVPNALMPPILREMDVCLQPSRAEACTNLPVKEAMACGIPVIAARNTGMVDLLRDDNAIVLRTQRSVPGPATDGWGESDVDEIVAALEYAYDHRDDARRLGLRSRDWLLEHRRTWEAHAADLRDWLVAPR